MTFRSRLLNCERLLGTIITLPLPAVAEICADAGFDWLFLDMEHGALGLNDVQAMTSAVGERCPCIVRVPINDRMWIGKVLDLGVAGIIVPQVLTVQDAERAVFAAKYPPQGGRGIGAWRAARYGANFQDYLARANDDAAVIIQIEHIEAVRNVEAIAGVPGVDALMIGPSDLSGSFGKPGKYDDADVQAAIAHVREVGMARGMPLSLYCTTIERAQRALREGYTLMPVSADTSMFVGAAQRMVGAMRA